MTVTRSQGEIRYMNGLWNADSKGFAAGQDKKFTESDNPYKQFEHRQFWAHGFRRARSTLPIQVEAVSAYIVDDKIWDSE